MTEEKTCGVPCAYVPTRTEAAKDTTSMNTVCQEMVLCACVYCAQVLVLTSTTFSLAYVCASVLVYVVVKTILSTARFKGSLL